MLVSLENLNRTPAETVVCICSSKMFTGKHFCWNLFFNKVARLRHAILFFKKLQHRCFPVKIAKSLRTAFFIQHLCLYN